MKKDKEWLEKEINKTLNIDGGSGERIEGFNKGLEFSLDLIEELDQPEVPVIPQFVADYLNDFKKQNLTLGDALDTHFEDDEQIHRWLYEDGEVRNDEVFARAWLDGYTVEKETMYYVILVESEDKEYGQALYKDFNFSGDKVVSTHIETFSKRISLEAGNFHFTEQEIKAIDERYWAFAVEVTDNV